jgi:GNAT superfamily N-acetyltransferase
MAKTESISIAEFIQPHFMLARLDDFEAVATLFAALHGYNTSLDEKFALAENWRTLLYEHFVRTYASDSALWLLAWQGRQPVGLLVLESHIDSPLFQHRHWIELVALYVDPSQRKTGLSDQLLFEAQAWTATRGFDRMQLYVTTRNERARSFYRRCGWYPVQEIWRKDVEPGSSQVSHLADPSGTTDDPQVGCGSELLEISHHHFAMAAECTSEQ